jgi:hypothetical protein
MQVTERRVGDTPHPGASVIRSVVSGSQPDGNRTGGYRLAPDVLLVTVHDGSGRLLDLAGSVFTVSETGAAMLEAALQAREDAACEKLAARFNVDPEQVRADMTALLTDLERQRLVSPPGVRHRHVPSLGSAFAWLIAPIVLACARSRRRWTGMRIWLLLTVAYFATRLFGWTNTIRVWRRCLVCDPHTIPMSPGEDSQMLADIDQAVARAIARHALNMGCKERALCCWTLADAAGFPAKIVLGIDLFPFALHCWCESRSRILADRYEGHCDRYTPILAYG